MYIRNNPLLLWCFLGFIFIISVGTILHFTYEWSNSNFLVSLFSPINESVWEHLKLGFFSLLFFSIIDYWFLSNIYNNYFLGKLLGILTMEIFIVVIFYLYSSIVGHPALPVDISLFFIGAALCQLVSYKIMNLSINYERINTISLFILLIITILFFIFTISPPKLDIFKDPRLQ